MGAGSQAKCHGLLANLGRARVLGCADAVQRGPSHGAVRDLVSGKQRRRVPVPGMERDSRTRRDGAEGRRRVLGLAGPLCCALWACLGAWGAVWLVEAEVTRGGGFVVSGGAPSRICTPGQERQGMVVRVADWLLGALTPSTGLTRREDPSVLWVNLDRTQLAMDSGEPAREKVQAGRAKLSCARWRTQAGQASGKKQASVRLRADASRSRLFLLAAGHGMRGGGWCTIAGGHARLRGRAPRALGPCLSGG